MITPPPPPTVRPGYCSTGNPPCHKPARLYAAGWRCHQHAPGNERKDTTCG